MKKAILLIMIIFVVGLVNAVDYTDFIGHYLQSASHWGVDNADDTFTNNAFLLRSTSLDTGMDYTLPNWDFCSVLDGGTELGVVPIYIYDIYSTYEYKSVIATYPTEIKQYDSDCNVIDTYSMPTNMTMVSKMGIIRDYAYIDTGGDYKYDGPSFAVVGYNNYTSKTYMFILTLEEENATLILDEEVLISNTGDFTDPYEVFGVAGGCFWANDVRLGCTINNRVFGVYNDDDRDIRIVSSYPDGNWELKTQVDLGDPNVNVTDVSSNKQLFFADYDNDNYNDFILVGGYDTSATTDRFYVTLTRISPKQGTPWFANQYQNTYNYDSDPFDGPLGPCTQPLYEQQFSVCQLGDEDSELEICLHYYSNRGSGGCKSKTAIVNNAMTSVYIDDLPTKSSMPFSYKEGSKNYVCIPGDGNDFECVNETLDLVSTITGIGHSSNDNNLLEVLYTNIDGNDSNYELMFSNGSVYQINPSTLVATKLTDWSSTFDSYYNGEMMAQSISNDDNLDFIYFDTDNLRIYSNDLSVYTPINASEYQDNYNSSGSGTTTSTTTTNTLPPDATVDDLIDRINTNKNLIFGLFLIVALIVAVASLGVTSPIILSIVGIVGAVIATAVGLLSTAVIIILIVGMIVLLLLFSTIFRKEE